MGHVDSFDAHMSRNEAKHKNYVWRRTMFLSLLKITLVNSWIYYKHSLKLNEKFTQQDFLIKLREEIQMEHNVKKTKEKKRKIKEKNKKYYDTQKVFKKF